MLENERIVKARKKNMKLYPVYRMLGTDIVFLYAIKMLFLTRCKRNKCVRCNIFSIYVCIIYGYITSTSYYRN